MNEDKKEIKKEKKQKKQINLKELIMNNKKIALGILVGVVAIIIIIVLVVVLSKDDNKEPGGNNGDGNNQGEVQYPEDAIFSDEDTIKDEYGFSKEDAINAVKKMYHSDNYTYEAKARNDNMYEVTVTNTETKTVDVYEVNPNDGSFTYIIK